MKAPTHITKVLPKIRPGGAVVAVCALLLAFCGAAKPALGQANGPTQNVKPAEALYQDLGNVGLDPTRVFKVREASLDRASVHITLEDGTIAFTKDVMGRVTGAFFEGYGEVLLTPPNEVERRSMSLFTGMAILEERFATAYFRFNDDSASQLQSGLRAPENAEEFVTHWDQTAHNLAQGDAMRLLATFSALLPGGDATGGQGKQITDPNDRFLHVRLQGEKLGVFDIFYDSTASEQIEIGQPKTAGNGNLFYDVWASFYVEDPNRSPNEHKKVPQAIPAETESREEPILVNSFVIDANVKPPKDLEVDARLQLEVKHGGSRCLSFELSRFLDVKSVEADGKPVEFIHNEAVPGTRRARSSNDLVAVILPEPARNGQQINLHFVYAGEVLAEAGPGLLYVGARGTWYPNRGLAMANFDLTFHYPSEWTLLATGKPVATVSGLSGTPSEQTSHWISERPIPLAGFNLGKYHRASAPAGNVTVEAYATRGVEREFPKASLPTMPIDPRPPLPSLPPAMIIPPDPSPARNAAKVADASAAAIRFYAERFGPFPYGNLALTQLPGEESQGWPGLIFLSSYAFLSREELADLHMNAAAMVLDSLIPAHETAHQWWGDLVTWSTYRDQWFSEGLANYCALMIEQEKDPESFRLILEKYRRQLVEKDADGNELKDAGPVTLGSRLFSSHFPDGYEAISYGRGTWLFYMLHTMMKDAVANHKNGGETEDPFVRALKRVRERYEGKAITTRELLQVFAEDLPAALRYNGKSSLDWFLDGWVNGTSLPELELRDVKFAAKGSAVSVTGSLRQSSAPPTLVTSVPIYAVMAGKSPLLLGRVFADGPESVFHLTAPAGTRKVVLDANDTILTAPK